MFGLSGIGIVCSSICNCRVSVTLLDSCFFPHWKENLTKHKHKNTDALFGAAVARPYCFIRPFIAVKCGLLLIWLAHALGNESETFYVVLYLHLMFNQCVE